jgi:hypothetical protein
VALLALLCASCVSRGERSTSRDPFHIDWNIQKHVLESRAAFDEATDRKNDYDSTGTQLAH